MLLGLTGLRGERRRGQCHPPSRTAGGKMQMPSRRCDTTCMDSPGGKCAGTVAFWEEQENQPVPGNGSHVPHHEDGVLPGTELLTRSVSSRLASVQPEDAQDTSAQRQNVLEPGPPSVTGSPGVLELYGPHCHHAEWAVMGPFSSQGAAGEEGAS